MAKKSRQSWDEYQEKLKAGYNNEEIVSLVNTHTEVREIQDRNFCFFECPDCGKEIEGMNRNKVAANAKTHMISKHSEKYLGGDE